MFKKIAIGCGVIVIITIIAIGIGVYMLVSKGKEIAEEVKAIQKDYAETNTLYTFEKPDPAIMEEDRLIVYLSIREDLMEFIAEQPNVFKKMQEADETGEELSAMDTIRGMLDMVKSGKKVADMHIDALHDSRMSIDEYRWYLRTIMGTVLQGADEESEKAEELIGPYKEWVEKMNEWERQNQQKMELKDLKDMFNLNDVTFHEENLEMVYDHREKFKVPMETTPWLFMMMMTGEVDNPQSPMPSSGALSPETEPSAESAPAEATP